jgi:cyclase
MPADLCKRIIPCLDVDADGRTVKGVRFSGLRDIGDPVDLARRYQDEGADELLFLDISASVQGRGTMLDVVEKVARDLMIPFTVGGGISSLQQARALLQQGADKVTVNTAAVRDPDLISAIADAFGSQCCVLAIDARRASGPDEAPRYEVLTHGGRTATGLDALTWAREAVRRGAGEVLLTSWDRDGTREGFDLALTRALSTALPVPVIASGGAAGPESFLSVFREGCADAALAASIFHDEQWSIAALKARLHEAGIQVRL